MFRMKLPLLVFYFRLCFYVFIASHFSFHYMAFVFFCMSLLPDLENLNFRPGVYLRGIISWKQNLNLVSFWTVLSRHSTVANARTPLFTFSLLLLHHPILIHYTYLL